MNSIQIRGQATAQKKCHVFHGSRFHYSLIKEAKFCGTVPEMFCSSGDWGMYIIDLIN